MSDYGIFDILCRGLLRARLLDSVRAKERAFLMNGTDAVSCTGACVALWMDIVVCILFLSMTSVWSRTLIIGIGPIVFAVSLLYVAVTILSTISTEEAVNGGLSTYTSCTTANTTVHLTCLS